MYEEGFVDIRYTIGVDGHVRDALVSRLIGPQVLADTALASVKQRTFHPALADGKPVEQVSIVRFDFRVPNYTPGARPSVAAHYDKAVALMREGKLDDAFAMLIEARASPRMNYYERTMLAYATALIYMQRKDFLSADIFIRLATIHGGVNLDSALRANAIKLRIENDIYLGQMADALQWFDRLKSVKGFSSDDSIVKFLIDAQNRVEALDAFRVKARIPKPEDGEGWSHILYRRDFAFQNIVGTLDHFQLHCSQATIESNTSEKAEWHVPPDWSNCDITVFGAPDTTFDLIEAR
jgi:hypothetical protein